MLKEIKNTSKHAFIYALGNIGVKAIGLILIPFFTNPQYLSRTDYGALAVLEATLQLLVGLLTMAMGTSLIRWYWDDNYQTLQKSIFFTSFSFLFITISPLIFLISLFSKDISILLFKSTDYSQILILTFATAGLQILNNQALALAKVQAKSLLYSSINITKLSLSLVLILIGLVHNGKGLESVWGAYLIAEIVSLFILIPYILKNSSFVFHTKILKEMFNYGFPLMLASVSGVMLSVTDRYMLSSMSGLEKTGIYSLGFRIASSLRMIISTSLLWALTPLRMKKMNEPNNQRFYSKTTTYLTFIFTLGLLLVSLFSLEVLKLFTGSSEYWEANGVVPFIAFSLLFGLIKENTITGLTIMKKTKIIGLLIFLTSLLNIALNLILVPIWDIYGAATATLFSQIIFMTIISIQAQKAYYIPYEWMKIVQIIVLSIILISIGLYISNFPIWYRLPIKLALFLIFPFILYFLNFYEAKELETLKVILKQWKTPSNLLKNFRNLLES